jgi:hypothetical protein
LTNRKLRFVGLGILITGLFWTRAEELNTNSVSILGGLITGWVVSNYLLSKNQLRFARIIIPFIWGITPITLLMMFYKNGIHGHAFPEYSLRQTQDVILRMPIFLIIGYGLKKFFINRNYGEDS